MIEAVQQNFVQPLGLAALLALIPLIIFYLVKPKPEKEVMPSMTFFTEEKQRGRIKNALQKLKRNKILLLHIFIIVIAAVAIANPLISGLESDGESVIILDTSASMNDNQKEARNFAEKHLGQTNTVIAAGSQAEVIAREATPEAAQQAIRNQENTASTSDLVSALQLASNFDGKLVLASDLAHTGGGDFQNRLGDLVAQREAKAMDLDHENSHGFTGIEMKSGEVEVTVQNFLNHNNTVNIEAGEESQEVEILAQSTETVSFELGSGRHEVTLPPDELALDNKLYVLVPQDQALSVKRLGDESRYFKTAVELINQTNYESGTSVSGADIYYVSRNYELNENRLNTLEEEIENGKGVVFEARNDLPSWVPAENRSRSRTAEVQVESSISTSFSSDVTGYDTTGSSLSQPREALVLSEGGRVLLYNVDDEVFGQRITYPIFWKNIFQRMTNQTEFNDLNMKTGQSANSQLNYRGQQIAEGEELQSTGFYTGENTYGVNLLKPEESRPQTSQNIQNSEISSEPGRDPGREYFAALLAFIALFELFYLSKGGALE